jgi:hypothetical protein
MLCRKKYIWLNHLLNVRNVGDVRHKQVHTAEPLVPGPSHLKVEIVIEKFRKYKSPGSDQISAELIQAGCKTLVRSINSLILFGISNICLISGRSLLLYQFTERGIKLTLVIIV